MDEQMTSKSARGMLTDLLADAESKKLFADAVMAAFVTKHGGSETEYNLDTLGRSALRSIATVMRQTTCWASLGWPTAFV
jgi:hypothetical protein